MAPNRRQVLDAESVIPKKNDRSYTFEEAVSSTGLGKFHYVLMLGCAMGQFGVVFQLYITSYLLPSIQCDFRITAQEKGLLTSISYVGDPSLLNVLAGVILGSYLWGLLADTKGRKRVLVITLMLDAICGLLSSLAPDFYVFLALRLLNGFFICCPAAVIFPYFGEFFDLKYRPSAIMAVSIYLPLGLLILPGVAWLIIPQPWLVELPWCDFNSWRIFVAVSSLPSAIGCLIMAWILPESPKYLFAHQQNERTLQVLRHMYSMNTGNKEDSYAVQHITPDEENVDKIADTSLLRQLKNMWFEQTVPLFKMPHILRAALFFVYEFGAFGCFNSFALWLPDIFNNMATFVLVNGRSGTICESMYAVFLSQTVNQTTQSAQPSNSDDSFNSYHFYNVSNNIENNPSANSTGELQLIEEDTCEVIINPETFTNSLMISTATIITIVVTGVALKWIRQKPVILVFLSVAFAGMIAMNFVQDATVLLVVTCLFFCTCATSANVMLSAAVDLFPTNMRAMAVCLGLMLARAGVVIGSQIFAALIEQSCSILFYIAAGTILVCGIMAFLLPDTKNKT